MVVVVVVVEGAVQGAVQGAVGGAVVRHRVDVDMEPISGCRRAKAIEQNLRRNKRACSCTHHAREYDAFTTRESPNHRYLLKNLDAAGCVCVCWGVGAMEARCL